MFSSTGNDWICYYPPLSSLLSFVFCLDLVLDFFLYDCLVIQLHPLFFISAACLWSRTRWQQLHVLGAACAGSPGNPGERLFVWRGQVDHEEHAICHVLLRAGTGELVLPPTASDGGQQLTVPLWVLQVLQGDHIGQSQLTAKTEATPAAPHQEAKDTEEEEKDGDGCYGDVGGGSCTADGLTWGLALWVRHKKIVLHFLKLIKRSHMKTTMPYLHMNFHNWLFFFLLRMANRGCCQSQTSVWPLYMN